VRILAVDIGTGTQDILLFDSEREPENCLKLVMPSPTVRVAEAVRAATAAGQRLLLTGVTMGGGPSAWAVEDHRRAGLPVFATPDAARTFNDDLDAVVADLGVTILGEDEAAALARRDDVRALALRDFDLAPIRAAFAGFGVTLDVDLIALAVFDHGAAPPDVSDRAFRFDYLRERLDSGGGLAAFAFPRALIPPIMTRLAAAAASAPDDVPVWAMDTAPAAVLGALDDPRLAGAPAAVVANVGNFHALAFCLAEGAVAGLFEHHTGLVDGPTLTDCIRRLAEGTLTNEELFDHHGHGALVRSARPAALDLVAVTGPRRALLADSPLAPYFAVPHGDMMLAGCWGLVRACQERLARTGGLGG
jgi:uncharacterized protein (DUF1786 family)